MVPQQQTVRPFFQLDHIRKEGLAYRLVAGSGSKGLEHATVAVYQFH